MSQPQRWVAVIALLGCAATLHAANERQISAEEVDAATQKAVAAVMSQLRNESDPATTALRVMAVVNAGVHADDPIVAAAIKSAVTHAYTIGEDYRGTYQIGIVGSMLGMIRDPRYEFEAGIIARKIQRLQEPTGGWGDNSRTQYALLGLKGARDMGVEVKPAVFSAARRYLQEGQEHDGGWGYGILSPPGNTMTAAGISSYFIVTEDTRKNCPVCGQAFSDGRLELGVEFLGKILNISEKRHTYFYYYLYALERIGVLVGQKYIGGHDWFREGAAILVKRQGTYGTWDGEEEYATEFALLFLGKGGAPPAIQKLNYGPDWNPDPYDAKEITELAMRELKMPMSSQVVDMTAGADELSAAPILYLQGRAEFQFTPEMRSKVQAFCDRGGFIVASACCGGAGFNKSFHQEMKAIFPDDALEALPASHEIYTVHHKIAKPQTLPLEGLVRGCRTTVFYAPHDLCCAWSGCKGCLDKFAGSTQEARKLGVNLIAYAVGFQGLKSKLNNGIEKVDRREAPKAQRGTLLLGQIYHEGDWNPDPASLPNLARTLKEQTGMKTEAVKRQVVLGSGELGEFPILYLTGHKRFQFAPSAEEALRTYLDRGGFLLCEPCCGKADFDDAFRKLCAELYPDSALKKIPLDHPVFREPYDIKKIVYKPMVGQLFPDVGDKPCLEGIVDPDGRIKILYSRFNFGCELQGHSCVGCLGITGKDAYRIAVNAVLYALSH